MHVVKPVFLCEDCSYYVENPYDTAPDLAALIESRSGEEIAFVELADMDAAPRFWCCDMCLRPEKRFLRAGWVRTPPAPETFTAMGG